MRFPLSARAARSAVLATFAAGFIIDACSAEPDGEHTSNRADPAQTPMTVQQMFLACANGSGAIDGAPASTQSQAEANALDAQTAYCDPAQSCCSGCYANGCIQGPSGWVCEHCCYTEFSPCGEQGSASCASGYVLFTGFGSRVDAAFDEANAQVSAYCAASTCAVGTSASCDAYQPQPAHCDPLGPCTAEICALARCTDPSCNDTCADCRAQCNDCDGHCGKMVGCQTDQYIDCGDCNDGFTCDVSDHRCRAITVDGCTPCGDAGGDCTTDTSCGPKAACDGACADGLTCFNGKCVDKERTACEITDGTGGSGGTSSGSTTASSSNGSGVGGSIDPCSSPCDGIGCGRNDYCGVVCIGPCPAGLTCVSGYCQEAVLTVCDCDNPTTQECVDACSL